VTSRDDKVTYANDWLNVFCESVSTSDSLSNFNFETHISVFFSKSTRGSPFSSGGWLMCRHTRSFHLLVAIVETNQPDYCTVYRTMMRLSLTLLLAFVLGSASASNNQELASGEDVVANLADYSKLYVSYRNCAWSSYADGCDVEGGEDAEDLWYLGLTECYRANVAYSLYGVKTGEKDKGCTKATFINSFFTTSGIETFTAYMAAAGVSFTETDDENQVTSDCNVVEAEEGNEEGENNNNNNNNYATNNRKIYSSDTSYGVGCVGNSFALKQYQGIYCDERTEPTVTDTMSTFNSEISQAKCVVIYDASSSSANEGGEDEGGDQQDGVGLLQYSEPCDIRNFPNKCPDPYGKLKREARANAHTVAAEEHSRRVKTKKAFSWIFLIFGIILLVAAAWAYYRKQQAQRDADERAAAGQKKKMFRRSSNSKKASTSTTTAEKTGFWGKLRRGKSRS